MTTPQSTPSESWRPVVGYEGLYEVSDLGRVRSLRPYHGVAGRILVVAPNSERYLRVDLSRAGQRKHALLHVLVARAFLGPCPPEHEVNHKDRDRANPRLDNLEYVTKAGNARHAIAAGRRVARGEGNNSKLTEQQVREIRAATGTLQRIADRFGIATPTVYHIRKRNTWRHI